ncbi:hypothetical protein C8R46DRAFT_1052848 [Mycena filopes]|nr:hypothetical protein C8R46DRAFT_1052848 [Mycena filopes]
MDLGCGVLTANIARAAAGSGVTWRLFLFQILLHSGVPGNDMSAALKPTACRCVAPHYTSPVHYTPGMDNSTTARRISPLTSRHRFVVTRVL